MHGQAHTKEQAAVRIFPTATRKLYAHATKYHT